MSANFKEDRQSILRYLSSQLIGPVGGENELIDEGPDKRYLMGILYPVDSSNDQVINDGIDTNVASDSDEVDDSPLSLLFQRLPATVGISFVVSGSPSLFIKLSGARYEKLEKDEEGNKLKNTWKRTPVPLGESFEEYHETLSGSTTEIKKSVLEGRAKLHVIWRKLSGDSWLTTVSLINAKQQDDNSLLDPSDCLFQVSLECMADEGSISEYINDYQSSFDEEEDDLSFIYRDKVAYAIGHGCAASWELKSNGKPQSVCVDFMPTVEVKPVTTEINASGIEKVLNLQWLSNVEIDSVELERSLTGFVDLYSDWIYGLAKSKVPSKHKNASERILKRLHLAETRMRKGVSLISNNEKVRKVFLLSNLAMLMQMVHSRSEYGGSLKAAGEANYVIPEYFNEKYSTLSWRPFQLAFQLMTIESLVTSDSNERDLVDLLWFPTGGGKTEAYLGLAAFEILYRRLVYGSKGAGTAVIKRYTLRLLTSQQFSRASALICALENIRKKNESLFGRDQISLGLWVGGNTSPNKYTSTGNFDQGALELYEEVLNESDPENPFQLQSCPWCGTRIIPEIKSENNNDYGVRATQTSFKFFCPTEACEFHEKLPISVVDEDLYDHPPSMLIGTIDKFARLVWDSRARSFFGITNNKLPPSLIIQDELHLISGPLGTIAGVYESAIDALIKARGVSPKYIAATATIRRAGDQVRSLMGRDVSVFPPSGYSSSDSYFAKEDEGALGRLYVGVMGQGATPTTSLVQLSAVMSQAVQEIDISDVAKDSWWTQLIYHNSKRELGKTLTLARDDIPARVKVIASTEERERNLLNVEELSANVKGSRIPEILNKLKENFKSDESIDVVPCTNMISVGVDVSRLGVILINGQPKTTAEYIQATSRVGRSKDFAPGISIALYRSALPRDRSHYETFTSYHQALYRWVEPTSVTPFSPPSRERAMHAALVILMRYVGGLNENSAAIDFDMNSPDNKKLISLLEDRMIVADASEKSKIASSLHSLVLHWNKCIDISQKDKKPLRFDNGKQGKQFMSLLTTFDNPKPLKTEWKTLNSMRNVDQEVRIAVVGEPRE